MAVSKKMLSKISALLKQAHSLHVQHQYEHAARLYEKVLKISPQHLDALNLLGVTRYKQGRFAEAGRLLLQALRLKPDFTSAWVNYGNLRMHLHDVEGAMQAFQKVLEFEPNDPHALLNIGNCLRFLERYHEAELYYYRSLAADPTLSLAWANLGKVAHTKDHLERAMKAADASLDCPDPAPLGLSLWIEVHRLTKPSAERALRTKQLLTHPGSSGELLAEGLFFAHHIYGMDPQVLLRGRDRVQQQIEASIEPSIAKRCPPPRPEPLTIGFVSSAFRRHPVAFMALGALEHLGRQGFRINIYSGRNYDDSYAQRFRACADVWRDISQVPDADVVELMRADGVDVLFDLSGITNHGRPRIPAMRAAPLQIKWVGGQSGPSGIPNMDAFLTDAVESPPWADADHRERLLRMPHGYVTYTPPVDAPEPVQQPPVQHNGLITFGSLNKLGKLSTELLEVWVRILKEVPNSRLLLRANGADQPILQNAIVTTFAAAGVGSDRLSFEGSTSHREFLETYNRVDIALDSFPYTGGLTTCEALWMGVPVVTLAGRFFAERHAATHLHNVGLGELVAEDTDEYVAKAIALAQDHELIARYRAELRDQVARSPLGDHERFAADLAQLIRAEWACRFGGTAAETAATAQPGPATIARAHELLDCGDADGAVAECRRLLNADETSAEVWELAGRAAAVAGRVGDAIDMLRKAVELEPDRASALQALLESIGKLGGAGATDQCRSELLIA